MLLVKSAKFHVWFYGAVTDEYSTSYLGLEFLREMSSDGNYKASAKGFKALFERYADSGTNQLTTDLFHQADSHDDIYEFVKGGLRVFCFKDGNKLIITNGAIKKTQKAPKQEVAVAANIKKQYFKSPSR